MRVAHDVSSAEAQNRIESGEEELLERLYAGDVGALEGVYALHSGYVMGIALRVLRDRPEVVEARCQTSNIPMNVEGRIPIRVSVVRVGG